MKNKIVLTLIVFVLLNFCFISCNKINFEELDKKEIEKYTQEIQQEPNKASAYINRAMIYNDRKEYELALTDLEKAMTLEKTDIEKSACLSEIVKANLSLKKKKDICSQYTAEALQLNPNNTLALRQLGREQEKNNEFEKAIETFNKAIEIDEKQKSKKSSSNDFYNRGVCYYNYAINNNKNVELLLKAIDDFSYVIKNFNPNKNSTYKYNVKYSYLSKGLIQIQLNDNISAIKNITKALQLDTEKELVMNISIVGDVYYDLKDYAKATEYFQKFLSLSNEKNPVPAELNFKLAFSLYKINKYEEAIDFFTKTLEQKDFNKIWKKDTNITENKGNVYYLRGESYFKIGKYDLALSDFNKALKLNKNNKEITDIIEKTKVKILMQPYVSEINSFIKNGKYDSALSKLNEVSTLKTNKTPATSEIISNEITDIRTKIYKKRLNRELPSILGAVFIIFVILFIVYSIKKSNIEDEIKLKLKNNNICSCGNEIIKETDSFSYKKAHRKDIFCRKCVKLKADGKKILVNKFNEMFENDRLIDDMESTNIDNILNKHLLTMNDLPNYLGLGLSALRRLYLHQNGEFFEINYDINSIDFIPRKDEKLYLFLPMKMYQTRVRTHYEGGSVGGSIRIAKGLSLRTSSFKGNPIRTEYLNFECSGTIYVTDKRVVFNGRRSIVYPLNKITRFNYDKEFLYINKENQEKEIIYKIVRYDSDGMNKATSLMHKELIMIISYLLQQ